MATITPLDCDPIRQFVREKAPGHLATKPQLNAAVQAIENWFEANRPALNAAINTATAPLVLAPAENKALLAGYLKLKFGKEA